MDLQRFGSGYLSITMPPRYEWRFWLVVDKSKGGDVDDTKSI